jgi:two-component system response regulator FlrC
MAQVKLIAKRVASRNAPVFIQGESGTGKELFARYIHQSSNRSDGPFVGINCAALPESLIESELFGHEKGAFTGAIKAREGKFELASTGTLFLDEITEIPIHLQSKLLRVLQESEVDKVGGKYPVPVDVRVIASTNVPIDAAMKSGQFRRDLYYRLNVIPLKLPALRERREDIPLLCLHFIEKYNHLHGCDVELISPEALKILRDYSWPGNVRELENVIQRAMLLTLEPVITPEHIMLDENDEPPADGLAIELMPIDEMEKLLIHKALASHNGNRTRAAEILGISVRTLRNKLNEYGASQRPEASEI